MIASVSSSLNSLVGNITSLTHASGPGRAYELYIMTGIAKGLSDAGCQVHVQRSDESSINATDLDRRFIQRGGAPTGVAGRGQGSLNASSFVFCLPQSPREWEIWNGIQFIGRSTAMHEIDIAIVPREVGRALRALSGGGRPIGRPKVSIECKDVGVAGSPDEMRSFVARLYDLTILGAHRSVRHLPQPPRAISPGAPIQNDPYQTFWAGNSETFNVLARRTGFAKGALYMANYYGIQPRGPIFPGSIEDMALVDDLVTWITRNLR